MNMRMILHLPAPGMENAEEPGSITREVGRLLGERAHGLRCCLKERRVCEALMGAEEIPELGGNRTGNHEVGNGQEPVHTGIEPRNSLLTLTGGTVAVTTRSEDSIGIRAVFARRTRWFRAPASCTG